MSLPYIGKERQIEFVKEALDKGTFLPKTVEYEDIDEAFNAWAEEELNMVYDGTKFPTMVLYSNQRFTEYSQTWKYTDANKNLILNFKTITRENNPQFGKMHEGLWNIPGERFYTMKRHIVLDDNGSESIESLKMKQPWCVDMIYKVSIFTTYLQCINEFNMLVNDKFKARQAYITPNGYYMPMVLESISDKSSYQIDDRQFYSQTFQIKVMAYIIREEDFRVDEIPIKRGIKFNNGFTNKRKANVDIWEDPCADRDEYNKPLSVVINFPRCVREVEFEIDTDFDVTGSEMENVNRNYKVYINDVKMENNQLFSFKDGDSVRVRIIPIDNSQPSLLKFIGSDPRTLYKHSKDDVETILDAEQSETQYVVESD